MLSLLVICVIFSVFKCCYPFVGFNSFMALPVGTVVTLDCRRLCMYYR